MLTRSKWHSCNVSKIVLFRMHRAICCWFDFTELLFLPEMICIFIFRKNFMCLRSCTNRFRSNWRQIMETETMTRSHKYGYPCGVAQNEWLMVWLKNESNLLWQRSRQCAERTNCPNIHNHLNQTSLSIEICSVIFFVFLFFVFTWLFKPNALHSSWWVEFLFEPFMYRIVVIVVVTKHSRK